MKFNIRSKALLAQLQPAGRAVSPKSVVPILSYFLWRVQNGELQLIGSDSENAVSAKCPVQDCDGEAAFCVEAARITELLKGFRDAELTFKYQPDKDNLTIVTDMGRYSLATIGAEHFPEVLAKKEDEGETSTATMPASVILAALDAVEFAKAKDDFRPQLCGVSFAFTPDAVTIAATDSHVLAKYRNIRAAGGQASSFILPSSALPLLRAILTPDAEVTVEYNERAVVFRCGSRLCRCSLAKGRFPDYERIIPRDNNVKAVVELEPLRQALRRMTVFADQESYLARVTFDREGVEIAVMGMSSNAREKVPCLYEGAEPLTVAFHTKRLGELLASFNTANVRILMKDAERPVLFLPGEQTKDAEVTVLTVPLRLGNDA